MRYRRKPGRRQLPPQTHGNNIAEIVWTVVPTIIVAFLFVISWQTLNAVDAVSATPDDTDPGGRRPVPVDLRYLLDDWEPTGRRARSAVHGVPADRPRGRTRWRRPGRPDGPAVPDSPRRHPRLLRPAVPVQARRRAGRTTCSTSTSTPTSPARRSAASAPSCAAPATASMLFDVTAMAPADYEAWLQGKIDGANAPPPAPSGAGAAAPPGEPGASAPPPGRRGPDPRARGQGHRLRPDRR